MDNRQYLNMAYIANRNEWMQFGGPKVNPLNNIPNKKSNGDEWQLWHTILKDNFGKKQANAIFLKAWKKQSVSNASTIDLRAYLSKNGINLEKGMFESAQDAGSDLLGNLGDLLQVGKYVVYGVVGITVVGLGMIVFNVAKNPIGAAKAAAAFTPAGAAGAAAGAMK